ncbi:unnamed protein product [Cylicocyclus nassatus]|uniref:Uncharacterized protein n=1 Tax=Cylicocyclus nassatus TaxID=53992 RepID=A0AA36GQX6_CYLNA|nr:unnamed protein product [Cylicocyclus nassatus]
MTVIAWQYLSTPATGCDNKNNKYHRNHLSLLDKWFSVLNAGESRKRTVDVDASEKITVLLYLTKMLTHDILKPRGTLSNVALCMHRKSTPSKNFSSSQVRTGNREVIAVAKKLFYEILIKDNLLMNVYRQIASTFDSRHAFGFSCRENVPNEFCNSAEATAHNKHIAHYSPYFISQLSLSDSSFYKGIEHADVMTCLE